MTDAKSLKAEYTDQILSDEAVQAVGIGLDDDGNEVLVVTTYPGAARTLTLPTGVSDEDVVVEERGDIQIETAPQVVKPQLDRKAKHRPVPCGVSAGHPTVTAGTVGFNVTDGDEVFTASNNHVYAAVNQGESGDPIIQPGDADGGGSADQCANLANYVPVEDGTLLDFAWAIQGAVEFDNELVGVGTPTGETRRVEVGDTLIKSGRTTGVTEGTVEQVDVSVDVGYGDAGTFTLEDQIITTDMSDGGDSGSAVLHKEDNAPAAVLFAGSDSATVHNQAVNINKETGLEIVTDGGGDGGNGGKPTATVELTMTPTSPDTGNIEGTVVDKEDGSGVGGATVTLQGDANIETTTDSSGEFSAKDVTIGEWQISSVKDGYEKATATVTEGDF